MLPVFKKNIFKTCLRFIIMTYLKNLQKSLKKNKKIQNFDNLGNPWFLVTRTLKENCKKIKDFCLKIHGLGLKVLESNLKKYFFFVFNL